MTDNEPPQLNTSELKKKVFVRLLSLAAVILSVVFFVSAGSFLFWEAWVYMAILLLTSGSVMAYFVKHDPELLDRRMRLKEKEQKQKTIIKWGHPVFIAFLVPPGLDHRYGWSDVPVPIVLAADCGVLAGYFLFIRVLKENRYASRIIEVEKGQKVVTTGLYAVVRHPMYLAATLLHAFSALALGSYWALIPVAFLLVVLVARILNEESVLRKELEGYEEYMRKTRFRLIPGVW